MLERTYRANRFDDALAQVKKELGADAMILSTRQIPGTGLMGARPQVEVVAVPASAATDEMKKPTQRHWTGAGILERRLARGGVPKFTADALSARVRDVFGAENGGYTEVSDALAHALSEQLRFAPTSAANRPRVMAFCGPTGVGKTTTIAKIAAQASLVEGQSVALICMDRYKIGGVEQLERYADLIGIPLACAFDTNMLNNALDDFASASLVLIDTEGRTPRDMGAFVELGDTFKNACEPIETHLCLSASMREAEMEHVVERMSAVGATKLTMTKLDEAIDFGAIVAACTTSGLPLAYFTTGQRVPEDMEVATPQRLAAVLCGEEIQG